VLESALTVPILGSIVPEKDTESNCLGPFRGDSGLREDSIIRGWV
jgi:hypothetical protein